MKFCTFCGAQLKDTAKFCVECGNPCAQPAAQAPAAPVNEPVAPAPVEAPVSAQPEPTYAPPEPANTQPEPAYTQPEPAYTQPEPAYTQPEPAYTQPEPAYTQPEPAQPVPPVPPVPPAQPAAAPAKKKGNAKLALLFAGIGILVVALIVVGILFFTGKFGGSKSDDLGIYRAETAEMWGISVDIGEIFGSSGFTIELKNGGVCTLTTDGSSEDGTWTKNGSSFSLTSSGIAMDGTLKKGVITLENVLGMGLKMTFAKNGAAAPSVADTPESDAAESDLESALSGILGGTDTTEPEAPQDDSGSIAKKTPTTGLDTADNAAVMDFWARDWYGWWVIVDATGDYADANGYWWDCCASIQDAGNGKLYMEIWDETFPRSELLASATLTLDGSSGSNGVATADNGMFLDDDLSAENWYIDPDTASYDDMIDFTGSYADSDGSFSYYFCLRPWGTRWDDVALDSPDDVPYYYTSWYLPLIDSGAGVPDVMDVAPQSDESDLLS